MNSTTFSDAMRYSSTESKATQKRAQNLSEAKVDHEYIIRDLIADDPEVVNFLFTLGCFKGEAITLISILSDSYVISIKDARYSLGKELAMAVLI